MRVGLMTGTSHKANPQYEKSWYHMYINGIQERVWSAGHGRPQVARGRGRSSWLLEFLKVFGLCSCGRWSWAKSSTGSHVRRVR